MEWMNCAICLDIMEKPCTLPCGHSACLERCLRPVLLYSRSCPECRAAVDARTLRENIKMREAIEQHQQPRSKLCQECDSSNATVVCQECVAMFCDSCSSNIHRRALSHHHVVPMEERSLGPVKCTKHPTKILEYFCPQCSVAVCVDCSLLDGHSSHEKMMPLVQAIERYTDKVTTLNNYLQQCVDEAKNVTNEVNASINTTSSQCLSLFTSSVESCFREPTADVFYSGQVVSLNVEVPDIEAELSSMISKGKDHLDRMQKRYNDMVKKVNRVAGNAKFGGVQSRVQSNAVDNGFRGNRKRRIRVGVWVLSATINDLTTKLNKGLTENWGDLEVVINSSGNAINNYNQLEPFDVVVLDPSHVRGPGQYLNQLLEAGKGLVLFNFYPSSSPQWFNYSCFSGGNSTELGSQQNIVKTKSNDPIFTNVNSFAVPSARKDAQLVNGTLLAIVFNGSPLIAKNEIGHGRIVEFGCLCYSSDLAGAGWQSSTDGHRLIANSVVWASKGI
ncbi:hypothetical protein P9112_010315 [Eukaryota sp. TZLM1-RC]